jgi:transcriptional regulator with XRE-family HTH domain
MIMTMNEKTKLVKEKTGMNIKDLAREIGYHETTIINVLRGKNQSSYQLAKILAEKTGMSPLYFLENDHGKD